MMNEAKVMYDKIVSKADKLYQEMQTDIETQHQLRLSALNKNKSSIQETLSQTAASLQDLVKFKGKPVDTKAFLGLQDIVTGAQECKNATETLFTGTGPVSFAYVPDKVVQDFLSFKVSLGSVAETTESNVDKPYLPKLQFPAFSRQTIVNTSVAQPEQSRELSSAPAESSRRSAVNSLSKSRACKVGSYNVQLRYDKTDCWITGIAITKDGRRLLADQNNKKIKMFSREMELVFALLLPSAPLKPVTASCSLSRSISHGNSLAILTLTEKQAAIKKRIELPFYVSGISKCDGKIIVACPRESPPSAKLIDQSARIYWSLPLDEAGTPWHARSFGDVAIVTDSQTHIVTLLKNGTGVLKEKQKLDRKRPRGIIGDGTGMIYICCCAKSEVVAFSRDFSEHEVFLSSDRDGLGKRPHAIAYDGTKHEFVITYDTRINFVDCFSFDE